MFDAINASVHAILDLTFFGDGLARAIGFISIFVVIVLFWTWTQYLVTEAAQDIREWRHKRKAVNKGPQNEGSAFRLRLASNRIERDG